MPVRGITAGFRVGRPALVSKEGKLAENGRPTVTHGADPWFFWLFPIAFTIHNIEEGLWLPDWSRSAGRFHRPVGAFEFRFALVVLTSVAVGITALLYASGKQSMPSYLFFAFNLGMLINVFLPHVAATVVLKKYCPGLLTGILILLPTTALILWYGYRHEYFLFPVVWYITIPFAALVIGSIPVLFRVGQIIEHVLGRGNGE